MVDNCAIPAPRRDDGGDVEVVVSDVEGHPVAIVDAELTVVSLADRASLLIGFACVARRSELAHLLAPDVLIDDGLVVSIRSGKNVHAIRGVAIPFGMSRETCPVRAWRRWADAARLAPLDAAPGGHSMMFLDPHYEPVVSPEPSTVQISMVKR